MRSEINSFRADVASDLLVMRKETHDPISGLRKETNEQISGLRRAVIDYHSSLIGHGVPISELEARVRRVEQHLDLPAMETH